jgi:hypothetical protein
MRDFRPCNTLFTLNTTLHVSTLLGSSSGVLFFHYIRHCNVIFVSLCCGSRSWPWGTVRYGLLVNRLQNTLMVLALNFSCVCTVVFGGISLVGPLHLLMYFELY